MEKLNKEYKKTNWFLKRDLKEEADLVSEFECWASLPFWHHNNRDTFPTHV